MLFDSRCLAVSKYVLFKSSSLILLSISSSGKSIFKSLIISFFNFNLSLLSINQILIASL